MWKGRTKKKRRQNWNDPEVAKGLNVTNEILQYVLLIENYPYPFSLSMASQREGEYTEAAWHLGGAPENSTGFNSTISQIGDLDMKHGCGQKSLKMQEFRWELFICF